MCHGRVERPLKTLGESKFERDLGSERGSAPAAFTPPPLRLYTHLSRPKLTPECGYGLSPSQSRPGALLGDLVCSRARGAGAIGGLGGGGDRLAALLAAAGGYLGPPRRAPPPGSWKRTWASSSSSLTSASLAAAAAAMSALLAGRGRSRRSRSYTARLRAPLEGLIIDYAGLRLHAVDSILRGPADSASALDPRRERKCISFFSAPVELSDASLTLKIYLREEITSN
jgi:hypothetical protein